MGLFGKKKKQTKNIQPEPRPMELLEEYKDPYAKVRLTK